MIDIDQDVGVKTDNKSRNPHVAKRDFARSLKQGLAILAELVGGLEEFKFQPSDERRARVYMKMLARAGWVVELVGGHDVFVAKKA